MPCDIGIQTKIGRTSKGGSAALPEESPAMTVDEGEEKTPAFKILPLAGGVGGGGGGGGWGATLKGSLSLPLYAHFLLFQHFPAGSKLSLSGLRDKRLQRKRRRRLNDRGGEDLRAGSRAGFVPDGLGISDLMSLEYARGWHLTNLRFTSSSSGLRSGRFRKLDSIGARENSRRFLGVV